MGKEVDSRVVQMQFDNAQFERETKRSMSTIERLKSALNFDESSKSLDGLTKAARSLDLTPVSDGINEIHMRFKALDVVAATVISNITSQAMGLGKALTNALTIDPVKSGLQEYETQINAIQTILSNTESKGTTIDQVNAALDELNHYADMTIYNFTEMTKNIGTFTAAGVDLDTSVQAIKGIANLAAVSGSTSQQASNAMYQLSQALAAGRVTLMDWNSVVNAGMGGEVFQEALKETARVDGIAVDQMIAKHGSFRESLQEGWITSQVLLDTLAKFTGDLGKEQLLAAGYTEEQADAIVKMGQNANDAATKVKTFTQLIDTLKEALQSGWTQSWEYIFGDFEQAKEFWTEISDIFSNVINESANARNELLKEGLTSGWSQLLDNGITDSAEMIQNVLANIGQEAGVVTEKQIEAAGGFEKSLKSGWLTADMVKSGLNEVIDQAQKLLDMSDSQLKAQGYSRDSVKELLESYTNLNEEIKNGTVNLDELVSKMSKPSGRDNLVQSVRNVISAVGSMINPVKSAFNDIFPSVTSDQIYSFTERIQSFTHSLQLSVGTASKVKRVFKGVFSVFKIGANAVETLFQAFAKVAKTVSPVGSSLLDLAAGIGDFLVSVESSIESSGIFQGILDSMQWVCEKASYGIDKVSGAIESLSSKTQIVINPVESLVGILKSFVNFIAPGLEYFGTTVSESLGEFGKSAYEAFNSFDPTNLYNFMNAGMGLGILNAIRNFINSGKDILEGASGVVDSVKGMLSSLGEVINAWKTNKNAETLMTIAKSIGILAASLTVLSLIKPERLAGSLGAITVLFAELVAGLSVLNGLTVKKQFKVAGISAALVAISTGVLVLSAALKTISSVDPERLVGSVVALGFVLAELSAAAIVMSSNAKKMTKGCTGLVLMATAVRILASSVSVFSGMSVDQLVKGIVGVGAVLAELGTFAVIVSKLGGKIGILNGISFNLLATSLLILQKAVVEFGKIDTGVIAKGLISIGVALAEFAGFGFLSKFSKHIVSSAVSFTIMAAALNLLIDPITKIGSLDIETLGKSLVAIGVALGEFVIALNLMKGGLGSAVAIATMSASMILMANAFKTFNDIGLGTIAKTLLSVAGALTVFGVAAALLAPVTPIIVALSLSLSALAAAIGLLLVAASSAMLIGNLAGSLALLSSINFSAFLQGIKNVAWMLVEFIAGIIKGVGEIASTLVTSIAQIITAICNAIVEAAPAIGNAISTLVITLCDVIKECAPAIAETVIYLIAQLWEAIKWALDDMWVKVQDWVDVNIIHHDWFGISAMINDFKTIWSSDAEKAGEDTAQGYVDGIGNKEDTLADKVQSFAEKAAATWNRFWGINSPSKLAAEGSDYVVQGYIQGIQNGVSEFNNAILGLAQTGNDTFRDFWGIHSPSDLAASDAENIAIGLQLGMVNSAEASKAAAEYLATHTLEGLATDEYNKSAYAAGLTLGTEYEKGVNDATSGTELLTWLKNKMGLGTENKSTTPTTSGTKTKKTPSGTKTKKTVAETIEEKYKDQLEANKTLQEVAESEYNLWMTENENSVSSDEILAKKMEYTAKKIENQTARVAIAQQKYDEMVQKVGAGKQETKEAYSDLLTEKNSLAELKANQYANLYEDQLNRLSIQNDRADKEYQLWVDQNNAASDSEKTTKKVSYMTSQLEASTKELELAQKQHEKLLEEYGESDLRTQEAYNDYLDAQIAVEEKRNELYKAQLEEFDNALNLIDRQANLFSQRASILSQIYDDGDLSSRSDDYIAAVDEYGKNSKEALRAKYQGSSSAVLGVATALRSMSSQLQKTSVYQAYYNELMNSGTASAEELNTAQQQLISSQSAFVSYASNLADAFDMDEEGKQITVRLAYSISQNWDTIYGGLKKAWSKVAQKSPELTKSLEKVFGAAFSDTGIEISTGIVSMVTSALSGDYGGAIASGLTAFISFIGSDMGQNLISSMSAVISSGLPDIASMIGGFLGSSGALSSIGSTITGLISSLVGGGGLSAALGSVGTAIGGIVAGIPELLPFIAIAVALAGVAGLLISNWDKVGDFFNNLWESMKEIANNLFGGLIEGLKDGWNAFSGFVTGIFGGVINLVKSIFGIHSPSTVFEGIGIHIDEGMAKGIESSAASVNKSVSDMASSAINTAKTLGQMLYDSTNGSGSYSMKVTPVMDMTDAKDSNKWFQAASVGVSHTYQLRTDTSERLAISASRNVNQNGKSDNDMTRGQIVQAIDALSEKVVMMGKGIENMQVSIDGRKLVGSIVSDVDNGLGKRASRSKRGG